MQNKRLNTYLFISPVSNYTVTDYHTANHPFNFHSRSPYIDGADYSLIFYGENAFNTFQHQLYYTYNTNEGFHRIGYTGVYGGWFVQPFIDVNQTWNRYTSYGDSLGLHAAHYKEANLAAGLQLPLNFTGGLMYRNLLLSASFHHTNIAWQGTAKSILSGFTHNYGEFKISYSQSIQAAPQHIYPHFGQSFLWQYRAGGKAYQMLATGNFYFPGFAATHSFIINSAYQLREKEYLYNYDNNFSFSRGYNKYDYPRMWKLGANYHFPVAYPDWGFGNIVYCLRIRANVFFDYTGVKNFFNKNIYNFNSTGAELFFDTRWWNEQPVSFGIRYSNLLNLKNSSHIDFVVPVLFSR